MKVDITQKFILLFVACHLGHTVRAQNKRNCGYLNVVNHDSKTHIADLTEYPWIGRVGYETDRGIDYRCLAVLITTQHLLAPAECFFKEGRIDKQVQWILLGNWNPRNSYELDCDSQQRCNKEPQLMEIEEIATHPNYSNRTFSSNLSIIKLVRNVTFNSYIQAICLSPLNTVSYYDEHLYSAGFAVNSSISYKLKSTIQTQNTIHCRETLYGYGSILAALSIPLHPLCAKSNLTTPLLKGSPLMGVNELEGRPRSYFLIGLLQNQVRNQSDSYTFIRVEPHIKWIERTMQSLTNMDRIRMPSMVPAHLDQDENQTIDVRTNILKI